MIVDRQGSEWIVENIRSQVTVDPHVKFMHDIFCVRVENLKLYRVEEKVLMCIVVGVNVQMYITSNIMMSIQIVFTGIDVIS